MGISKNRYGVRIFAQGEEITNNTRVTGLNNNDLIIGTSGTGKTGGYVVPAIQSVSGSLVVSDTKGQLERRFRKELEAKGYKVHVIDFVNPGRSCGYNPLQFIRKNGDGSYREQDILTIAKILCPMLDEKEPIWDMCAAGYLAFLIAFCLETKDADEQNLFSIFELRREFAQEGGDLIFADWAYDNSDTLAAKKFNELMANRKAEKMWASIEGFVSSHLAPFDCNEMKHIFASSDNFDINELGKTKTVLFINQSDTDRAFDKLVNLLHSQMLQTLCSQADANPDGRLNIPVRMILDDFASGCTIPDFDKVISVIRSRDISVNLIIQSLTQLETLYDHPTSVTIINNCDNILYLGSQDKETAEYIAYRAAKTPETVLSMPRTRAYLIRSGEKARLVKKIVPYSTLKENSKEAGDV